MRMIFVLLGSTAIVFDVGRGCIVEFECCLLENAMCIGVHVQDMCYYSFPVG